MLSFQTLHCLVYLPDLIEETGFEPMLLEKAGKCHEVFWQAFSAEGAASPRIVFRDTHPQRRQGKGFRDYFMVQTKLFGNEEYPVKEGDLAGIINVGS